MVSTHFIDAGSLLKFFQTVPKASTPRSKCLGHPADDVAPLLEDGMFGRLRPYNAKHPLKSRRILELAPHAAFTAL